MYSFCQRTLWWIYRCILCVYGSFLRAYPSCVCVSFYLALCVCVSLLFLLRVYRSLLCICRFLFCVSDVYPICISDMCVCVRVSLALFSPAGAVPASMVRSCVHIRQSVAVCCNTLHRPAIHSTHSSMRDTLQHTATHCNTLQHTATHCNDLRYT